MKMKKHHKGFHFLIFLAVFAGVTAVVMLLWNALIPSIIGWSAVTYWQSAGLLVLSRLLLGGIGHWRNGAMMMAGKKGRGPGHLHNMSPEARREFIRRRMADFCDCDPRETSTKNEE